MDPEPIELALPRLEMLLLSPQVRRDPGRIAELLDPDFFEFGSSGRVLTLRTVLDELPGETPRTYHMSHARTITLSPEVAMICYRLERTEPGARPVATRRTSLWRRSPAGWRMFFHQGTIIPDPAP